MERAPRAPARVWLGESLAIERQSSHTPAAAARAAGEPSAATGAQYKLYSKDCELYAEQDVVFAKPLRTGIHEIEIYVAETPDAWSHRAVRVEALAKDDPAGTESTHD